MKAKQTRVEILSKKLMVPLIPKFACTLRKSLVTQGKAPLISLHCENLKKGFNLPYHCSKQTVYYGRADLCFIWDWKPAFACTAKEFFSVSAQTGQENQGFLQASAGRFFVLLPGLHSFTYAVAWNTKMCWESWLQTGIMSHDTAPHLSCICWASPSMQAAKSAVQFGMDWST